MQKIITGHLVVAQSHENTPELPGTEGHIEIECTTVNPPSRPRSGQTVHHEVSVPTGLMDAVMPQHWNSRVTALVSDQNDLPRYTLITIDGASEDDPDGVTDADPDPQLPMAPPLGPTPSQITSEDTFKINLLVDALTRNPTTKWEAELNMLALWPESTHMDHIEIAQAIHSELRHSAESKILVLGEDDGLLLDYHITQLTADMHLAVMYPGDADHADHADRSIYIQDTPEAALLIREPRGSRPTELDSAALLQMLRPHVDTYLAKHFDNSGNPDAQSMTLWSQGQAKETNTRPIPDTIARVLAQHEGPEDFEVPLPEMQLAATVTQIYDGTWLATINPTCVDLKKRELITKDAPQAQILLRPTPRAA